MGTLFDYLSWRGDLSFEQAPLNEVDSLIFALLSFVEYKDIVAAEHGAPTISLVGAATTFFARNPDFKKLSMGVIVPKGIFKLLRDAKDCRRFKNVGLKGYVNRIDLKEETQFSAVTFVLETGETVVAYRGTDDTLIGWKENFNMSFMDIVPAQKYAKEYLERVAENTKGPIYVAGHSKGGNLAVYAAISVSKELQRRIAGVWCHDGPGFRNVWLKDPNYLNIKPRIKTLVPEASIVGMLLEHEEDYTVVKSRQKGAWQHDALNWEIIGGSFVYLQNLNRTSKRNDRITKDWVASLTLEQREQFCNAFYKLLSADNALTLTELMSLKNKWLIKGRELDPEVKKTLLTALRALIESNIRVRTEKIVKK